MGGKGVEKIVLSASGDVHDIRLIGTPDSCHNGQVIKLDDFLNIEKILNAL